MNTAVNTTVRCVTCPYFAHPPWMYGQCRRRPPSKRGWPEVQHDDWCAAHPQFNPKTAPTA